MPINTIIRCFIVGKDLSQEVCLSVLSEEIIYCLLRFCCSLISFSESISVCPVLLPCCDLSEGLVCMCFLTKSFPSFTNKIVEITMNTQEPTHIAKICEVSVPDAP